MQKQMDIQDKEVVAKASTPLDTYPGNVGNGAEVQDIQRVF